MPKTAPRLLPITSVTQALEACHVLTKAANFCYTQLKTPLYIVGGAVRDTFLTGQLPNDLDIVVSTNQIEALCAWVAKTYDLKQITLDDTEQIYRFVNFKEDWTLDVCAQQGQTIVEDLARRDITFNAMAIDLESFELIDPYQGLKALEANEIKIIAAQNFIDDPLRLLRVFRFQSQLGTSIHPEILTLITQHKTLIQQPAKERIYQEFFKLLNGASCSLALQQMIETQLFTACFNSLPSSPNAQWIEKLASVNTDWESEAEFLAAPFNAELSRQGLLNLIVSLSPLLSDNTQILPFVAAQKWSKQLSQFVIKALGILQNPPQLDNEDWSEELFLGLSVHSWVLLAFWQLSKQLSLKQAQVAWLYCQATLDVEANLPTLLTGNDIASLLQLKPGPEIGYLLKALRKQQRQGSINTTEEAQVWLAQFKNVQSS